MVRYRVEIFMCLPSCELGSHTRSDLTYIFLLHVDAHTHEHLVGKLVLHFVFPDGRCPELTRKPLDKSTKT